MNRLGAALAVVLAAGCRQETRSPPSSPLGGALARAGTADVAPSLVSRVARRKSESARSALSDLLSDALAAEAARASGMNEDPRVDWAVQAALARRVVRQSMDDAAAQGPARPDELDALRVVHAVVLRSARVPEMASIVVAEAIRRAVEGATSPDDFEARAKATPHGDARVLVERLPAFGADGQSAGGGFDPSFVAAAFALRRPGELSPVIATRFGWHVIYLFDRSPPADPVERARSLEPAIRALRSRQILASLLRARRSATRIEVLASAEPMMAEAKVP